MYAGSFWEKISMIMLKFQKKLQIWQQSAWNSTSVESLSAKTSNSIQNNSRNVM